MRDNRPVCEHDAPAAEASFLDPTVNMWRPRHIHLAERVYVAPFATLGAGKAPVKIGPESNVQDNVRVRGGVLNRTSADRRSLRRAALRPGSGIRTGERVILAHGSSVRGPARLGVGPVKHVPDGMGGTVEDSGVFVSFGAQVDGGIIERDSGLSALSRLGPGVRLRSGFIVLPGKNVTTQAQADRPALGKVRPIVEADREFNAGVVEVNVGLAREYTRLSRDDARNVLGANFDPGRHRVRRGTRPALRGIGPVHRTTRARSPLPQPHHRRLLLRGQLRRAGRQDGSLHFDPRRRRWTVRAGIISRMDDKVVFHALEGTDLRLGNRAHYGQRVILHGGGRPQVDPTTGLAAPTLVGNDVTLRPRSVVFRSLVRNDAVIGYKSAVVGSELRQGQVIPNRLIYANDEVFGRVEW